MILPSLTGGFFLCVHYISHMSKSDLSSYSIKRVFDSSKGECNSWHLNTGDFCAITRDGLKDHNAHNLMSKVLIGASVGAVCLPMLGIGGIGIVGGGIEGGIGLGVAEMAGGAAFVGAGAGAGVAKVNAMHGHGKTMESLELVNMVGRVLRKERRWWDQPGFDIKVEWKYIDSWGDKKTVVSWHDPEELVAVQYNG